MLTRIVFYSSNAENEKNINIFHTIQPLQDIYIIMKYERRSFRLVRLFLLINLRTVMMRARPQYIVINRNSMT